MPAVVSILENILTAEVLSPLGPLRLRAERPEDEAFRFTLFCESRPELGLLPDGIRERLMRQQFTAQTTGYAAQFPAALQLIVERAGQPIGRLVLNETAGALHVADLALSAALRRRGVGGSLLRALMSRADATDAVVNLRVSITNQSALRFYLRLGFKPVAQAVADIEMEWRRH